MCLLLITCGDIHQNPGPVSNCIRICHANVRSLQPSDRHVKLDEIHKTLCIDEKFDVICITETWLDETITDLDVCLQDYQIFRKDRNRHGGGVAIYAHDSLPVKILPNLDVEEIEGISIEVKLNSKSTIISCIYRPPGADQNQCNTFLDGLQDMINTMLIDSPESIVILGDFNDRCLTWDDNHNKSELGTKLKELIENNIMFQLIKEPTFYSNNYQSLLDLIITDSPGYINDSGVAHPIGDPSHCYIHCKLSITYSKDKAYEREIWKYNQANFDGLNNALSQCPWNVLDMYDDVDDMVDYFSQIFKKTCKEFIPNKIIKIRPCDKKWFTPEIRYKLKQRNKWHKRLKRCNSDQNQAMFKQKRAEANVAMMTAKAQYYETIKNRLCSPNVDKKEYWHLLSMLYGPKINNGIPSLKEGSDIISTSNEKADIFNKHFLEKSKLPDVLPQIPNLHIIPDNSLSGIDITEDNVTKTLKSLNIKKANGPDNISNRILKETANSICGPLTKIFKKSITTGKFPQSWKSANVVPVFKKGDKQNKNNYRPISLLPVIGKVLERLVFKEIYMYCSDHNILTWRNSGYKPLDSSINQLVYLSHKIYEALGKGLDVCYVSLDATAAFDRVWHDGLLFKLRKIGITGNLFSWLSSYLADRKQRVMIKGQFSNWENNSAGVPQGSILGPLLFLIYVNDIVCDIESDILLFADDTSILENISDYDISFEKINRDLNKLSVWSNQWLVSFNPTKTKYIIFSKKRMKIAHPPLYLGNQLLDEVSKHKQLGVTFNEKMTFDDHINENCSKAMKRITVLKRINNKLPRNSRLTIYKSFIRPIIEYGWQLYNSSTDKGLQKLEKIQRAAILTVTWAYKKTSHIKLLREVGLTTLAKRRQKQQVMFMHKHSKGLLPNYLQNLIPKTVAEKTSYNLRNAGNISTGHSMKKRYYLKSFIPSSIKTWNETNVELRSLDGEQFKTKLALSYNEHLNTVFLMGNDKAALNHSRIRMGLSALNAQRHSYNFIPSGICHKCNAKSEDTVHYFLVCPSYTAQRTQLLQDLLLAMPEIFGPLVNFSTSKASTDALMNFLMFGTNNEPTDKIVFTFVQNYIRDGKRFD